MEVVEVMYNNGYGGFEISKEAAEMYAERIKPNVDDYPERLMSGLRFSDRQNKVMIEVVKELGIRANTTYSNIQIKKFPQKYADHIELDEYDGWESLSVNLDHYKVAKIDKVINATLTNSKEDPLLKIQEIAAILKEEIETI